MTLITSQHQAAAMYLKLSGVLLLASFWSTLAGCSALTQGTAQVIAIDTYPPGCSCTLTREGVVIGEINPTPASVSVFKDKHPIFVRCQKEGYLENSSQFNSGLDGMVAGNVILGGVIGLMVDAGSGASHNYPATATILMIPENFVSVEDCDAYFERMRLHFLSRSDEAIKQIKTSCKDSECERQLKIAKESREALLDQISNAKSRAQLRP